LRAGIAALAIALVLAPVAFTKTKGKPVAVTAHAGDKATLTLSAATSRALKKAHVTLQAVKPSTHKKSTFTLPTKSGRWNFTAATGTLNLKGVALRVKQGKRAQKLGTLVFSLDSVPGLSVTPLGSASGGLPAPLGTTPLPIIDGSSVTLPLPTGDAGLSFAKRDGHGNDPAERRHPARQRSDFGDDHQPDVDARHRNRGLDVERFGERRTRGQAV